MENFLLTNESFEKALLILENCVSINNNLQGKLFSTLEFPIKFDERFQVTTVSFVIADFNLLSYELGNFTLNMLYWAGFF